MRHLERWLRRWSCFRKRLSTHTTRSARDLFLKPRPLWTDIPSVLTHPRCTPSSCWQSPPQCHTPSLTAASWKWSTLLRWVRWTDDAVLSQKTFYSINRDVDLHLFFYFRIFLICWYSLKVTSKAFFTFCISFQVSLSISGSLDITVIFPIILCNTSANDPPSLSLWVSVRRPPISPNHTTSNVYLGDYPLLLFNLACSSERPYSLKCMLKLKTPKAKVIF